MMMSGGATGLVDLFYDAALDTQLWPAALARLSDAVGGDGVALTYQNQTDGSGQAILSRLDPEMARLNFSYFGTRNPFVTQNNLHLVPLRGLFIGPDYFSVPRAELERSEYFNDFMLPFGVNSLLMVALALHGTDAAVINIMRPKSKDWFDNEETRFLRSIRGHLVRAFELTRRLSQAGRDSESVSGLLARSPHGLFLLDKDGRIRFANAAGEAMIAAGDGLRVESGTLATARPETTQRLAILIGKTARDPDQGGAILLPRRSGKRPYSLIVARMRPAADSVFASGPSVVVSVTDPEGEAPLPLSRLKELFGLTPAETRIAGEILAGHDPRAIARTLGLSTKTVRAHTANIFDKTQTNRQAELVRLMMQLSGYHG
jgi:DNA-binding CsgD family transcriptional regulator/PAS domain-containing protein